MDYLLKEGVRLHIIPTKKYKTILTQVRFTTTTDQQKTAQRALLANLLETNSLHYSDQIQVSSKLAELFGASLGINVSRKGNQHFLTVSMNCANEKFLEKDTPIFEESLKFLYEIIFQPNIKDSAFDKTTFELEKSNFIDYLDSVQEDKQMYAILKLQELYFKHSAEQRIPYLGTVADVQKETAETLANYYKKMLAEDQVDIFVIGDINEEVCLSLMKLLPFSSRSGGTGELFYRQPVTNIIQEEVERQPVLQSKLNIAYNTEIYYHEKDYFPMQVFNGIFGGFPHSKLFMNVREKSSMAYYASSMVDSFRGYLTVQTGIDRKNRETVLHLISEQLEQIQQGNISDNELQQTKEMLKNQYKISLDNPAATIEMVHMHDLCPKSDLSDQKWLEAIDRVTKEEIQKVAKQIRLQAVFFLEGAGA